MTWSFHLNPFSILGPSEFSCNLLSTHCARLGREVTWMNLPLQLSLNWSVPHWKVSRPCLVPCSGRVSHFPLVLAVDLLVGDGQSYLQEAASTRTYKNHQNLLNIIWGLLEIRNFRWNPKFSVRLSAGSGRDLNWRPGCSIKPDYFGVTYPRSPGQLPQKETKEI